MNKFSITYNQYHNTTLVGDTNCMKFYFPNDGLYNKLLINLNCDDKTRYQATPTNKMDCLSLNFKNILPGHYKMLVFKQNSLLNSNYEFCFEVPIVVNQNNRMVEIEMSPVYDDNKCFYKMLKTDQGTLNNFKLIWSYGYDERIVAKTKEITYRCKNDYAKAMAIHDYVSENIVYDMDSYYMCHYNNQSYNSSLYELSGVYKNKMAICEGFSTLTCFMLRATGIPAIKIHCHALGASTDGKWKNNTDSNHVFVGAFVDKRWILIDPTWDCTHEYIDGKIKQKRSFRRLYFDPTLEYISMTHKFCYVNN